MLRELTLSEMEFVAGAAGRDDEHDEQQDPQPELLELFEHDDIRGGFVTVYDEGNGHFGIYGANDETFGSFTWDFDNEYIFTLNHDFSENSEGELQIKFSQDSGEVSLEFTWKF